MQRRGLEWFYRLIAEPRRLWQRYLSIVPRFLVLASAQLIKAKVQSVFTKQRLA